jgi:hypothetical protein
LIHEGKEENHVIKNRFYNDLGVLTGSTLYLFRRNHIAMISPKKDAAAIRNAKSFLGGNKLKPLKRFLNRAHQITHGLNRGLKIAD